MKMTSEKTLETALQTVKSQQKLIKELQKKHELLTSLSGSVEALEVVADVTKGIREAITYLEKRKEWNFNWIGGGWNSEYAHTREEAYNQALDITDTLVPDLDTFRVATEADTKSLLSLFY